MGPTTTNNNQRPQSTTTKTTNNKQPTTNNNNNHNHNHNNNNNDNNNNNNNNNNNRQHTAALSISRHQRYATHPSVLIRSSPLEVSTVQVGTECTPATSCISRSLGTIILNASKRVSTTKPSSRKAASHSDLASISMPLPEQPHSTNLVPLLRSCLTIFPMRSTPSTSIKYTLSIAITSEGIP